jgi:hypothetical protein
MTPSHGPCPRPRPSPRARRPSPTDASSGLLLLALLPLLLLTACDFITAEPPLDLTASLEADRLSIVAGQAVRFSAEGTGDRLGALILNFGDGGQQTNEAGGARRASLEVEWVYEDPGTYLAGLEVIEFDGARASAFLEITVTPPAEP